MKNIEPHRGKEKNKVISLYTYTNIALNKQKIIMILKRTLTTRYFPLFFFFTLLMRCIQCISHTYAFSTWSIRAQCRPAARALASNFSHMQYVYSVVLTKTVFHLVRDIFIRHFSYPFVHINEYIEQ